MNFSGYGGGDTLELSKTTINISELVDFLRNNDITKLSLMDVGIDAEGVKALASSNLTNLISLDLSSNNPTDHNLRSHNIEKGLEALIEALNDGKFPKLTKVDVKDNNVSDEVEKRLSDALELNQRKLQSGSSKNVNTPLAEGSAVVNGTSFPGTQNVTITPTNGVGQTGDLGSSSPVGNGTSGDDNSEPKNEKELVASTANDHEKFENKINILTEKLKNTSKERDIASQVFEENTQTLLDTQARLAEKEKALNVAKEKISQLESTQQDLTEKNNELKTTQAQLEKERDDANGKVSQLEQDLTQAKQNAGTLTSKVSTLTQEKSHLENELKLKKPENNDLKIKLQEFESKSKGLESRVENLQKQLESKNGLESQIQALQEQLENKNKELNGKNEKFLGASAQSRKQVTYASVSLVLSGAFAVGASLTIPYSAICITLAVAASTFLAMGCYYSYKANTTLSNVKINQTNGIDLVSSGSI